MRGEKMSENTISVRLELKNKGITEEFKHAVSSVDGYRIKNSGNPGDCDLLILEICDDVNGEFKLIHSLKESGAVKEVFLTSSSKNPDVLIGALRSGAKEFFTQPVNREEIAASLLKFKHETEAAPVTQPKVKKGKIINVIGGKGGVGATTVAVNIAAGLNKTGSNQSVAIMDMNLVFGEIPLFLDIKTAFNWGEVAKNISRADSTYLMSALERHPSGVYVLPSPTEFNGLNSADPEIIERILDLMKQEFDYIVIDNGQSLNAVSLKALELSDTALIVSIPSLPCLINVKRLLETFWTLGYPGEDRIRIVMNRCQKNPVISVREAEEGIGQKIYRTIPNDYDATMSAMNQGKAISLVANGSEIDGSFRDLTDALLNGDKPGGNEKKKQKKGFFSIW
jgi:pilus assembly protein CpaE